MIIFCLEKKTRFKHLRQVFLLHRGFLILLSSKKMIGETLWPCYHTLPRWKVVLLWQRMWKRHWKVLRWQWDRWRLWSQSMPTNPFVTSAFLHHRSLAMCHKVVPFFLGGEYFCLDRGGKWRFGDSGGGLKGRHWAIYSWMSWKWWFKRRTSQKRTIYRFRKEWIGKKKQAPGV